MACFLQWHNLVKQYINKFLHRQIDEDILERCCAKIEEWVSSAKEGDKLELNLGSCKLAYAYALKLCILP